MLKDQLRRLGRSLGSYHTLRVLCFVLLTALPVLDLGAYGLRSYGQERNAPVRTLEISKPEWPKGVLELTDVKGLDSTAFPQGFQLAVKNVSDKPIYYFQIFVQFVGSKQVLGENDGVMALYYGAHRLNSNESRPESEDVALQPGETAILKEDPKRAQNFFVHLGAERQAALVANHTGHLKLVAQRVSFGDGTGYLAGSEYPVKKSISLN